MPAVSVASADGRQVIFPLAAAPAFTAPETNDPSVIVTTVPLIDIVALNTVAVDTKFPARLRSVAVLTRFSRVAPVELVKSIVSVAPPSATFTRIACEAPVQPARIEPGAIASL